MSIEQIKEILKDYNVKHNSFFEFKETENKITSNFISTYQLQAVDNDRTKWVLLYEGEKSTVEMDLNTALTLFQQRIKEVEEVNHFLENNYEYDLY